jgi:hypothetical protein
MAGVRRDDEENEAVPEEAKQEAPTYPRFHLRVIEALEKVLTGNSPKDNDGPGISPYRTLPQLMRFFNDFGFEDVYARSGGGPSRWAYVQERLRQVNGTERMVEILEAAFDPDHFSEPEKPIEAAVEYLNGCLRREGWGLSLLGGRYRLHRSGERLVVMNKREAITDTLSHSFINDQIEKSEKRLADGDFTGAITSARSLVEGVLVEIERRLVEQPPAYDGDLGKLVKRVQCCLNLDPKAPENQPFHMVLSGLGNVIYGLAPLRNKMSDAHPLQYQPAKHHAKLATNAAKTVCDFLFDTFEFQYQKGRLKPIR